MVWGWRSRRRGEIGSLRAVDVPQISVQDLAKLGPDVRLIDVREPDEWAGGHVAYAVHVPLGTVPDHLDHFDGSPTYVICRSGGRSAKACQFALANGLEAVNVAGGMLAWSNAELDIVSGA